MTSNNAWNAAFVAAAGGAAVAFVLVKRAGRYTPPKVWVNSANGGRFASINAPTAGARGPPKPLPVGKHPYQLYSLGTPNGIKVTMMLEELVETFPDFEYDAHFINIMGGDQVCPTQCSYVFFVFRSPMHHSLKFCYDSTYSVSVTSQSATISLDFSFIYSVVRKWICFNKPELQDSMLHGPLYLASHPRV